MLHDNQGQIRVLEAFFAAAVVFASLLLTGPAYLSLQNNSSSESLYSVGVNILVEMDRDGGLGQLIMQENWTELSRRVSFMVSPGVSFNLTVYNEDLEIVNTALVSSGSLEGRDVVSVQYIVAERTTFEFYIVRLRLAYMK